MSAFSVQGIISLATDAAEQALKHTEQTAETSASNIEKRFAQVGSVMKKVFTATAVVAAGKALMSLANETAAYGDSVDKMSQKLGMSRKAYQEWSYILSQNGADISSLTTAMRTMTKTMDSGSKTTKDALGKIGLGFQELNAMSQEDQLMAVVKGLAGMENQSERNAVASQLLGRSYQDLLPLINSGADSIDELKNRAHELGIVMDDETIDAAVNYGDRLDDLKKSWNSLKMTFGAQMLKPMTKAFEKITGWVSKLIPTLKKAFSTGDWSDFFEGITDIIGQALPAVVDTLFGVVNGLIANSDKLVMLAGSIITGLIDGIKNTIPKLITALPNVLQTLWQTLTESIPAAIHGALSGIWQSIAGWLGLSEEDTAAITNIFDNAFSGVRAIAGSVSDFFSGVFENIRQILDDDSLSVGGKITAIFDAVFFGVNGVGGLADIAQAIVGTFDNVLSQIAENLGLTDEYETFKGIFSDAFAGFEVIYQNITETFGNIFSAIKGLINQDMTVSEFIDAVFGNSSSGEGLWGIAGQVVNTFTDFVANLIDAILPGGGDVVQYISDLIFGSTDSGAGLFGIADAVVRTWGSFFENIASLINGEMSIGEFITQIFEGGESGGGLFAIAGSIVDTFTNLVASIVDAVFPGGGDVVKYISDTIFGSADDQEGLFGIADAVVKTFGNFFGGIQSLINGQMSITEFIMQVFEGGEDGGGIMGIAQAVINTFNDLLGSIVDAIFGQGTYSSIGDFIQQVFMGGEDGGGLFGIAHGVIDTFLGFITSLIGVFTGTNTVDQFIDTVFYGGDGQGGVLGIANAIIKTFKTLLVGIAKAIFGESGYASIGAFIDDVFGDGSSAGGLFGIANRIVGTFRTLFTEISNLFSGKSTISDFIENVFGKPGSGNQAGSGILGVAYDIVHTFDNLFGDILKAMGVDDATANSITDAFDKMFGGALQVVQGVVQAIGDVAGTIQILLNPNLDNDTKWRKIGKEIFNFDYLDDDFGADGHPTPQEYEPTSEANAITNFLAGLSRTGNGINKLFGFDTGLTDDQINAAFLKGQHDIEKFAYWWAYPDMVLTPEQRQKNEWNYEQYVKNNVASFLPWLFNSDPLGDHDGNYFGKGYTNTGNQFDSGSTWRQAVDTSDPAFQAAVTAYAERYVNNGGVVSGQTEIDDYLAGAGILKWNNQSVYDSLYEEIESYIASMTTNNSIEEIRNVDLSEAFGDDWFAPSAQAAASKLQEIFEATTVKVPVVPTLDGGYGPVVLPGHATGMDYVPFDNYVSRLHRGEAVLSAFEAAEWRSRGQLYGGGQNNTYTDNNTLYVGQMYMSNDLDAEQLQSTLATITRRKNRGYGL